MNKVFLLVGGNLGNREQNFKTAIEQMGSHCGLITRLSSLYETAAWGKTDQPPFLNQALEIETPLSAEQLMKCLLKIEAFMGRRREEKYGPRTIDIDILLFNNERYDSPFLTIPHPELQNRRFALVPLEEIAGEIQHPLLGRSITQLLKACKDKLEVIKYERLDH